MKAIRKINWHFQSSRIGYRLLKYFFAFSIVPIGFFSLPISIYVLNQSLRNLQDEATSKVDRISTDWELMMEDAYQMGNAVAGNSLVQETLKHSYASNLERYRDEILLDLELFRMLQHSSGNIDIYVVGTNGGQYKSSGRPFLSPNLNDRNWFLDMKEQKNVRWLLPRNGSLIVESLDEIHITLLIPVLPLLEDEISGVVLVDIYRPVVAEIESDQGDISVFVINDEEVVILNDEIRIIYNEQDLPELIRNNFKEIRYWDPNPDSRTGTVLKNVKAITAYRYSDLTNWVFAVTESKRNAYSNSVMIIGLAVGVVLILSVSSYLLSYRVSRSFEQPIVELSDSIARVRDGDFTARVTPQSDDEIGDLGNDFNDMVLDIKDLMKRIYEEQSRIKQYELMLLQAQINPHFLYNTLESIIWLIRMGETEDSIQMIQALTQFLRSGLSKGKEIINLDQEIDNVTNYLIIQQLRYKKQLSYEIDFPDSMLTQPLPKLILQPLVENALYHGIKNIDGEGYIHIYGYEEGRSSVIVVSDDGAGMDAERLNGLRDSDGIAELNSTSSYGFKNVRERLQLFFKKNCTLEIDSILGEGTTVTIRIHGEVKSV